MITGVAAGEAVTVGVDDGVTVEDGVRVVVGVGEVSAFPENVPAYAK